MDSGKKAGSKGFKHPRLDYATFCPNPNCIADQGGTRLSMAIFSDPSIL